jgi:non-specific protein-tyrosine kinase
MADLMSSVRGRFALVIVDLPSILTGAEAQAMTSLVDHLLLVVRTGRVSHKNLSHALELIGRDKLIGAILNDHRAPLPNWLEQRL